MQTSPSVWTSGNGGQQWILEGNFPGETGRSLLDLKLFKDSNGANWVFVCGENYLLQFTNDYNGNIPNGKALGSVWRTVNFDHIKFGSPQSGQSGSFVQELGQTGRWPDFCNMEISKINSTESQQLFGGGAPSSDEFHIWLGTSKYIKEYANTAEGTTVNISVSGSYSWLNEVYWTVFDSDGNVVQATSGNNSFTNQTYGSGPAGAPFSRTLWLKAGTYPVDMRDAYGDGWHRNSIVIRDMATNNVLGSGSPSGYGPTILTFTVTTSNTFAQYIEEFGYPGAATGYKDMVIRGNYVDFSNNTLDFSYNIITREIIDNSNNATKNFNVESFNSTYFGGKYSANTTGLSYGIITTDSYVFITNNSGVSWDKRLGVDRVELAGTDGSGNVRGSMGSYIEENKVNDGTNNYIYDNSSIYIQTSTEPWNGLP